MVTTGYFKWEFFIRFSTQKKVVTPNGPINHKYQYLINKMLLAVQAAVWYNTAVDL